MKIADFFINIGVKGADKSIGAIGGVNRGLGDIKNTAFGVKAAIMGALVGLEQMMERSARTGQNLETFASYMGSSVDALQRWQRAFAREGLGVDEITESFVHLKRAMQEFETGGPALAGLDFMAQRNKGFDVSKRQDPDYIMGQVMKMVKEASPQDLNRVMQMAETIVGSNWKMLGAMRKEEFNPAGLNMKGHSYTKNEAKAMSDVARQLNDMWSSISTSWGKQITAKHGADLVKNMTLVAKAIIVLIEAMSELAKVIHVFDAITHVVKGLALVAKGASNIFDGKVSGKDFVTGVGEATKGASMMAVEGMKDFGKAVLEGAKSFKEKSEKNHEIRKNKQFYKDQENILPNLKGKPAMGTGASNSIEMNFNFTGANVQDPQEVASIFRKAFDDVYRSYPTAVS